jgi:hypothetical protein
MKTIKEWSIKNNFISNTMVLFWAIKIVPMSYAFTTPASIN